MNKLLSTACALALCGCAGVAQADDCDKNRTVLQVMTDPVGTYDKDGNFKADIAKDKIVTAVKILDCTAAPALVQVKLKQQGKDDPDNAWVNLLEVKVGEPGVKSSKRDCKQDSVSQLADTSAPATSGIDPCSSAKSQ